MAEKIIFFIFLIPLLGVLVWSYFDPRESLIFGKRWMFKEEPEPSEGAIRYIKVASAISVVLLLLIGVAVIFV
ncbi:hypothetical protein [Saccharibacillus endophyticus]|uniref:DUF6199 domain-containing protein n=1 Tax=Saccharibacillus endophyticus TaxID=2060666 RepID=A0ABQ1ZKX7_9BACL|nr:hypothetical protein [Saccharibacillus endophyticus]GGH68226.1 hypothetical protein GCM10007362_02010 [Saccharibacillus endophyticus]